MHCEQAEMLLAQMAFGELKGEQEAALAAHLGECPRCSQALADMRSAAGLLTEAVLSLFGWHTKPFDAAE